MPVDPEDLGDLAWLDELSTPPSSLWDSEDEVEMEGASARVFEPYPVANEPSPTEVSAPAPGVGAAQLSEPVPLPAADHPRLEDSLEDEPAASPPPEHVPAEDSLDVPVDIATPPEHVPAEDSLDVPVDIATPPEHAAEDSLDVPVDIATPPEHVPAEDSLYVPVDIATDSLDLGTDPADGASVPVDDAPDRRDVRESPHDNSVDAGVVDEGASEDARHTGVARMTCTIDLPSVKGPILGLDIGAWECCVATFTPGNVMPTILSNNLSLQETRNVVAFASGGRFIGEEGTNHLSSNPKNTVGDVLSIVGRAAHEIAQLPYIPFKVSGEEIPVVEVQLGREDLAFRPEHVAAMLLQKIASFAGEDMLPAVLTVSASVAQHARRLRAVLDAAAVAGIPLLRAVTGVTAAAALFGYTTCRTTEVEVVGLFVDIGHSQSSAQVVSYTSRAMRVLSAVCINTLCGSAIDEAIVEVAAREIQNKYKLDVLSNPKSHARLRKECEKCKRTLSTAPTTVLSVDCIMDGVDIHLPLSRDIVDEVIGKLKGEIEDMIATTLQQAGKTTADIHAAEIIGGASRIPAVAQVFEDALSGVELGHHLDSAHCVADGAALLGATLVDGFPTIRYMVDDHITMVPPAAGLSTEDIESLRAFEDELADADENRRQLAMRRNELESFIYDTKSIVETDDVVVDDEKRTLLALLEGGLLWLDDHDDATLDAVAIEDLTLKVAIGQASPQLETFLREREEAAETERRLGEAARKKADEEASDSKPKERDVSRMPKTQRLAHARKLLGQGNALMSELAYTEACLRLQLCIDALHHLEDHGLQEAQHKEMVELRVHAFTLCARAYVRVDDPVRARASMKEVEALVKDTAVPDEVGALLAEVGAEVDIVAPRRKRRRRTRTVEPEPEEEPEEEEEEEGRHHRRRHHRREEPSSEDGAPVRRKRKKKVFGVSGGGGSSS